MWQDLARTLALLIKNYQQLEQLNEEKRGVLVLVKLQELEKLTEREGKLVQAIQQAEKDRQRIIGELSANGVRIDATMQMTEVWSQCPDAAQRATLRKLHLMLSDLVAKVQEANANNEILISGALEAVVFKLNQLGGSAVEPAYGQKGQEVVSHQQNFDFKA